MFSCQIARDQVPKIVSKSLSKNKRFFTHIFKFKILVSIRGDVGYAYLWFIMRVCCDILLRKFENSDSNCTCCCAALPGQLIARKPMAHSFIIYTSPKGFIQNCCHLKWSQVVCSSSSCPSVDLKRFVYGKWEGISGLNCCQANGQHTRGQNNRHTCLNMPIFYIYIENYWDFSSQLAKIGGNI